MSTQEFIVVVRYPDGTPIPGAEIYLAQIHPNALLGRTDYLGRAQFKVEYTEPTEVDITVKFENFADTQRIAIPRPGIVTLFFTIPAARPTSTAPSAEVRPATEVTSGMSPFTYALLGGAVALLGYMAWKERG